MITIIGNINNVENGRKREEDLGDDNINNKLAIAYIMIISRDREEEQFRYKYEYCCVVLIIIFSLFLHNAIVKNKIASFFFILVFIL